MSRPSSERFMYVQFTSCVYWVLKNFPYFSKSRKKDLYKKTLMNIVLYLLNSTILALFGIWKLYSNSNYCKMSFTFKSSVKGEVVFFDTQV